MGNRDDGICGHSEGRVRVPFTTERKAALQSGAGFWYGTSLPVGGENTHCVLAAHNGLVKATDLDKLEVEIGSLCV